jgi:hypothetical protein
MVVDKNTGSYNGGFSPIIGGTYLPHFQSNCICFRWKLNRLGVEAIFDYTKNVKSVTQQREGL